MPDSLRGKFAKLIFYAVNYVADVWLNGNYLGYHEGGYTPFAFDVTQHLRYDSTNVLAVRVDNPPWGTRNDIVPYVIVDWFNYTGIIHDVYLEFLRSGFRPAGRCGAAREPWHDPNDGDVTEQKRG